MEERTEQFQGVNMSPESMTPQAREEWERVHGTIEQARQEQGIEKADKKVFEQGLESHVLAQQAAPIGDDNVTFLMLEEEGVNPAENPALMKLLEIAWQKGPVQASLVARKFKDAALLDRLHDMLVNHYQQFVAQGHFKL